MARDGSGWDYINEHLGGHDEDGLPNFMNEPGFSDQEYQTQKKLHFNSFEEAKNWSFNNKGKVFTRSPDGNGFIPKDYSPTKKTLLDYNLDSFTSKDGNRFQGLDGSECAQILDNILSKYSHHLLGRFNNNHNFSKDTFERELKYLNNQQIIELKNVIDEYIKLETSRLNKIKSRIRKYRTGNYGVWEINILEPWVNDLEISSDLCKNYII